MSTSVYPKVMWVTEGAPPFLLCLFIVMFCCTDGSCFTLINSLKKDKWLKKFPGKKWYIEHGTDNARTHEQQTRTADVPVPEQR